jgi:hypothetical protein
MSTLRMSVILAATFFGMGLVGLGYLPHPMDAAKKAAVSLEQTVSSTVGSLFDGR